MVKYGETDLNVVDIFGGGFGGRVSMRCRLGEKLVDEAGKSILLFTPGLAFHGVGERERRAVGCFRRSNFFFLFFF